MSATEMTENRDERVNNTKAQPGGIFQNYSYTTHYAK